MRFNKRTRLVGWRPRPRDGPRWYNAPMLRQRKSCGAASWIWVLVAGVVLSACAQAESPPTQTPTPRLRGRLTPYASPAPSRTPEPISPLRTPTPLPPPSPTPVTYSIQAGDTLLAIAFQFGVTLDDLLTANPGIDPGLLSIGTELVIPLDEGLLVIASPTPVNVVLEEPQCLPTGEGGMWCFVLLNNEQPRALENPSAEVILYDERGVEVARQVAEAPLNLVPTGQALPLLVFFPGSLPDKVLPLAQLQRTFVQPPDDGRYLPVDLRSGPVRIAGDGSSAEVRGEVVWAGGQDQLPAETRVWVLLVAYGPSGHVVGVRRWEWRGPLSPGEGVAFQAQVFSLGGTIVEVQSFAEALILLESQ